MVRGNKGFADLIAAGGESVRPAPARLPPRTGILGSRENRLASLASGGLVTRVHELVDPARCRIWDGHNRDYAALTEAGCADLIESFRAQGRQEVPAIVRRVADDADCDFEVICGARRHWTVGWMRSHDFPDFRFLVEPRELTDEEAFRLADLENRHRKDLSDYERAVDYARAIDRYYGGSQQRMVERLDVTKSWLSRYLELARLPPEVIESFGSPHVIGISHAAILAPLLRTPRSRAQVLEAASALAREQQGLAASGATILPAAAVMRRIVAAGSGNARKESSSETVIRAEDGTVLAKGLKGRGSAFQINIPALRLSNRAQVLEAVEALVSQAVEDAGQAPRAARNKGKA
jgi:ParB family chromosome partitioning protein